MNKVSYVVVAGLLALLALVGATSAGTSSTGIYKGTLASRSYSDRSFVFYAHETAAIKILGESGSNLAVAVFDENGNRVAASVRNNLHQLTWTPRWTGTYTIRIINLDDTPTAFAIHLN